MECFFINKFMLTTQPNRPLCKKCNFALAKPNGKSKHGFQKWHRYCVDCAKAMYNNRFKHLLEKKSYCIECGFVPQDLIQLDVVYKNGDVNDKSKKNLMTLCANCSRLYNKKIRRNKKLLDIPADSDITI
jgi:hypothetical protein